MKLTLIYDGDEKLTRSSTTIKNISKFVIKLSHHMHQALKDWNGVGLSAVQVGYFIRLIVVNTTHTKDGKCLTMINPRLVSTDGTAVSKIEGCLSFPGKFKYRSRPGSIVVEYQDISGTKRIESFQGLTAQVIIHEMFHLDGITMSHENIDNFNILIKEDNAATKHT